MILLFLVMTFIEIAKTETTDNLSDNYTDNVE